MTTKTPCPPKRVKVKPWEKTPWSGDVEFADGGECQSQPGAGGGNSDEVVGVEFANVKDGETRSKAFYLLLEDYFTPAYTTGYAAALQGIGLIFGADYNLRIGGGAGKGAINVGTPKREAWVLTLVDGHLFKPAQQIG